MMLSNLYVPRVAEPTGEASGSAANPPPAPRATADDLELRQIRMHLHHLQSHCFYRADAICQPPGMKVGVILQASGSAYIEMGDTKVFCGV
jgi:hypothetical protein